MPTCWVLRAAVAGMKPDKNAATHGDIGRSEATGTTAVLCGEFPASTDGCASISTNVRVEMEILSIKDSTTVRRNKR